jgi:hypothetical protein
MKLVYSFNADTNLHHRAAYKPVFHKVIQWVPGVKRPGREADLSLPN